MTPANLRLLALAATVAACLAIATKASATPIEYTLSVPTATVTIGSQTYTGDQVTFTFDGNDSNVVSGLFPTGPSSSGLYSAIYVGTASVTVSNGTQVLTTAQFAPNQIVVSSDRSNGGLGFGFVPGGIGPSGFDVLQLQPLYPASITNYGRGSFGYDPTYDLTLAFAQAHAGDTYVAPSFYPAGINPFSADGSADIFGAVYSCDQFNGSIYFISCAAGTPLQTDLGLFTIGAITEPGLFAGDTRLPMVGEFSAKALSVTQLPEPSTLALTAFGLVCFVGRRNSRRASRS